MWWLSYQKTVLLSKYILIQTACFAVCFAANAHNIPITIYYMIHILNIFFIGLCVVVDFNINASVNHMHISVIGCVFCGMFLQSELNVCNSIDIITTLITII